MWKLFLVLMIAAVMIGGKGCPAVADDNDDSYGYKDTTIDFWHGHSTYLEPARNPRGVGANVVLFQSDNPLLEEVTAEYRYDGNNNEHGGYVIVRVNLFQTIKKKIE